MQKKLRLIYYKTKQIDDQNSKPRMIRMQITKRSISGSSCLIVAIRFDNAIEFVQRIKLSDRRIMVRRKAHCDIYGLVPLPLHLHHSASNYQVHRNANQCHAGRLVVNKIAKHALELKRLQSTRLASNCGLSGPMTDSPQSQSHRNIQYSNNLNLVKRMRCDASLNWP